MKIQNNVRTALWACALIIALPAALTAGEPDTEDASRIVVVQDDGREITIDMVAVNEIVNEAMEGVAEVIAEMEDMQFQMHLGRDNRLNLSYDETTFELDLDQIMAQVSVALEAGLEGLDTDEWTDSRDRWSEADDTELRRELDKLKDEMRELKRELRKAKDDI
jgi:hypothetical protein